MSRPLDDVASSDEMSIDESSADALDLSPRPAPVIHGRRRDGGRSRRWPWLMVLVAIIIGIGFVVSNAITDATQFFYTADEAVARQGDIGSRRFRLEGSVVKDSVKRSTEGASFTSFAVTFNGVDVPVRHTGDLAQLFQECIPVVVEGHWAGDGSNRYFASDRLLVKHSENYEAANPDRLKQADQGAAASPACVQTGQAATS